MSVEPASRCAAAANAAAVQASATSAARGSVSATSAKRNDAIELLLLWGANSPTYSTCCGCFKLASGRGGTPVACSQHAAARVLVSAIKGGSSAGQRSNAYGQRGWKRQPEGGRAGFGTSPEGSGSSPAPSAAARRRSAPRYRDGPAAPRARASAPVSTIRPRYITATRSATWRTIARSCEISSSPMSSSRESRTSRFATCACADASSAETARRGRSPSDRRRARARSRCADAARRENSCGYRAAASGGQADPLEQLPHARGRAACPAAASPSAIWRPPCAAG